MEIFKKKPTIGLWFKTNKMNLSKNEFEYKQNKIDSIRNQKSNIHGPTLSIMFEENY